MGRLSPLTAARLWPGALSVLMGIGACQDHHDQPPPPALSSRREAILSPPSTSVVSTPGPTPLDAAPPARTPRSLCEGAPLGRAFPKHDVGHGEAPGAASLGTVIPVGKGRWTWINLWAAWCVPCKEELPRLFGWSAKWKNRVDFHFVSLDDDERQLRRFLAAQPTSGLRSTYWLPEGKTRDRWLRDVGLTESPELPVQILVEPSGTIRCIIQGAVEDSDFDRVARIVGAR